VGLPNAEVSRRTRRIRVRRNLRSPRARYLRDRFLFPARRVVRLPWRHSASRPRATSPSARRSLRRRLAAASGSLTPSGDRSHTRGGVPRKATALLRLSERSSGSTAGSWLLRHGWSSQSRWPAGRRNSSAAAAKSRSGPFAQGLRSSLVPRPSRQPRLWSRHKPTPTTPGPNPCSSASRGVRIPRVDCETHRTPHVRPGRYRVIPAELNAGMAAGRSP
jgi:hypothetical protein